MCEISGRCLAAFKTPFPPKKKNAEGWMMFLSKAFKLFQKMHEDAGISICVMETAVFFSGRGGGFPANSRTVPWRAASRAFYENTFL